MTYSLAVGSSTCQTPLKPAGITNEEPAENVLNAWFEENKSSYGAPEYRTIAYVKLEPVDIAEGPAGVVDERRADPETDGGVREPEIEGDVGPIHRAQHPTWVSAGQPTTFMRSP